MRDVVFRIISGVMTALFALAVAVQYNDPDPVPWMMIYGAAGVLSAWVIVRRSAPVVPVVIVGLIALGWGLDVGRGAYGKVAFSDMFQSWEMKSPTIEEARETSGLLIIAFWMAVLAIQAWLTRAPR